MKILLIETSSKYIEFGYSEGSRLLTYKRLAESENADTLVYHIKKEFDEKKINIQDVDVVSISNGPGSFTGIRISSAISKGMCFALNCKLIEIVTLDIIANKFRLLNNIQNSEKEIISLIFSKMKNGEFYVGYYKINDGKLIKTKDYEIKKLNELETGNKILVTNDMVENYNNTDIRILSESENISSQLDLALQKIEQNLFSDPVTSEPFYLKEFIPLGKKKM